MQLIFKNRSIDLERQQVMGILNVTPDSFSDGGLLASAGQLQHQIEAMLQAGVDIFDVGGESTRPGSQPIALQEELSRVIPAIELIRKLTDTPISIDTTKPEVMRAAVGAGADMVNDVNALRADGALEAVAELGVPVCLMHMRGQPKDMQQHPEYIDVVKQVSDFFVQRIECCVTAGINRQQIILDPGFGFGKTVAHNFQLLKKLEVFHSLGRPLLVGASRKSMLGAVTGKDVNQRLAGSLAAAVIAAMQGAHIIRVHDVAETVDALKIVQATQRGDK